MTIDEIITRFADVKRTSAGYQAKCPAHQDNTASLSISSGDNHNTLIHCHAGCSTSSVVAAAGLSMSDLFDEPREPKEQRTKPPADTGQRQTTVATYRYRDENDKLIYEVLRKGPIKKFVQRVPDDTQPDGWRYNMDGVERILYRLKMVLSEAAQSHTIFVCEGEKDVENMAKHLKLFATTGGSAGRWQTNYTEALRGAHVVILPDNDTVGKKHAEDVARQLIGTASTVRILMLPNLPPKGDVSDWIESGGTREQLIELLKDTPRYIPKASSSVNDGEPFEFRITDAGNAREFAHQYGDKMRYDISSGKWMLWSGKHWEYDEFGLVRTQAETTIRGLVDAKIEDFKEKELFIRHLKNSLSINRLDAMVSLASTNHGLGISNRHLDANDWVINCNNGTLDLETCTLRPHRKEDLITKIVPVNYNPHASAPRWEQFLREVFNNDEELISYVQRAAGYTLTGLTTEQCFFMLYGNGSNGKSKFLDCISDIMNDYYRKTATETILSKNNQGGGIPNDVAALAGARFVSAVEVESGRQMAESLVKEMTGGDELSARFLRCEFFSFKPKFKLWISCNNQPVIKGMDNGIWRRIKQIPFTVKFYHDYEEGYPKRDNMLGDKLRMEYEGIFAWMVQGCREWQNKGLGTCTAVEQATEQYRESQDQLSEFLNTRCKFGINERVKSSDLYKAYKIYAEGNGQRAWSTTLFGMRIMEHGKFERRRVNSVQVYFGLSLLQLDDNNDTSMYDQQHEIDQYADCAYPAAKTMLISNEKSHVGHTEIDGRLCIPCVPEHEMSTETTQNINETGEIMKNTEKKSKATSTNFLFEAGKLIEFPYLSYSYEIEPENGSDCSDCIISTAIPAGEMAWRNRTAQIMANEPEVHINAVKAAIKAKAKEMAQRKEGAK